MHRLAIVCTLALAVPTTSVAQGPAPASAWLHPDASRAGTDGEAAPFVRHDVQTEHAALVLGGTLAMMFADRPIHEFLQSHRSRALDRVASVFRTMGTVPVYGGVTVGVLAAGVVSGDHDVQRAGGRLALGALSTVVTDLLIKKVVGRARPDANPSPWDFDPLKRRQVSFLSGHSAEAFALATALSDDLHNTWASVALYTFATGTAWSRLNDNRHWPSDVVGGAMLGMTIAKVINNRWEVLDINPPRFLLDPPARSAPAVP